MSNAIIKNVFRVALLFLLGVVLHSCEINQKEILPEDGFLKIYNTQEENLAIYPESLVQLTDGGYIFISSVKDENPDSEYPYAMAVRTDNRGEVIWSSDYDWLSPVSNSFIHDGEVGFVAMNVRYEAYVILIDPASGAVSSYTDIGTSFPLATYIDSDGNLLVLSYDQVSRSSRIVKYNNNFSIDNGIELSINEDVLYEVQRHLNKLGQSYPFFIGEYSIEGEKGYYVNCFHRSTLKTVFLDDFLALQGGEIFAYQTEEGISSLVQKTGTHFGITSYFEGNNYILPDIEIALDELLNIKKDTDPLALYELNYKASVRAGSISNATGEYSIFITQTNSNSLVCYQYAQESDSLVSTIYKDFDDQSSVCDFIQTSDQGIAILAQTHILGKHKRPVLLKYPKELFEEEE